jgi:hypothetical protein
MSIELMTPPASNRIRKRAPWWVWPLLVVLLPLMAVAVVFWFAAAIVLQIIVWIVWCSRGRYALVVYSNSPIWQEYFERHVLPAVGNRGVVLNWSDRKEWSLSLPVALFRFFAGFREFNPLAIVFQPLAWPRRFRFYRPFRAFKNGHPQEVEGMRGDLLKLLDDLAPLAK